MKQFKKEVTFCVPDCGHKGHDFTKDKEMPNSTNKKACPNNDGSELPIAHSNGCTLCGNKETWKCGYCKEEVTPNGEHLCEINKDWVKDMQKMYKGILSEDLIEKSIEYWAEYWGEYIRSLIKSERQAGIEEERDSWINQPANEHDEKIRQAERTKIKKMVESIEHKQSSTIGEHIYYDTAIIDILEKLKEGE